MSARAQDMVARQSPSGVQLLEQSRARYQKLVKRQTTVQVEIEAAKRQHQEALDEAEREYGTRDLEALRALYAQREAQNEQQIAKFIEELDALEQALTEVERELAN